MQALLSWVQSHKDVLEVLLAIISAIAVAGWTLWKTRSDARDKSRAPDKQPIAPSIVAAGHVNMGGTQIVVNASVLADRLLVESSARQVHEAPEPERQELIAAIVELQKQLAGVTSPSRYEAALAALERGDTHAAERLFESTAKQSEADGGSAYRHLGALAYLHDTHRAIVAFSRATELDPQHPIGWNMLGVLNLRVGALDQAEVNFLKVLNLGQQQNDRHALAMAYGNLATISEYRGVHSEALELCELALSLSKESGDRRQQATGLCQLGLLHGKRGDACMAIGLLEQALQLHTSISHKRGMSIDNCNLGIAHRLRGDLGCALDHVGKALDLAKEVGAKQEMAYAYINLAILYESFGNPARILKCLDEAFHLTVQMGDKRGTATTYRALGQLYFREGDLDGALEFHENALSLDLEIGIPEDLATDYYHLGLTHAAAKNRDQAVTFYRQSEALALKAGQFRLAKLASSAADDCSSAATLSVWRL